MFDFGKNALLKRIEELELLLEQQKRENADKETQLKRFHEQEEFQQRSFQEIKLAMEVKLKELDGRIREFEQEKEQESLRIEAEKTQMRQRLKEEADSARSTLKLEMDEEKKRARETLKEQVRSFHLSYSQYLAGIQSQMELLTQTSIQVGDRFPALDHADVQRLFEAEMGKPAMGKATAISEITSKPVQPEGSFGQIEAKNITDLPRTGQSFIQGEKDNERVEHVMSLLSRNGGKG